MTEEAHTYGGPWTDQKLAILREYLSGYTTALSRTKFKKGYIDAFAGTGRWQSAKTERTLRALNVQPNLPHFGDPTDAGEPVQYFLDGSARIALQCRPPFDSYVFIEKNSRRRKQLEALKSDFPHLAERISIKPGDANAQIQVMCSRSWGRHRAVLFLDPYGAQVRWKTIEFIARTKAIDLWILFPLGGVNRMLTKTGKIPLRWRDCMNDLLGTTTWDEHFYRKETSTSLFGGEVEHVVKATTRVISDYFLDQLRSASLVWQ